MAIITVSASYGTGGSAVAHHLADQLGARLLERAVPALAEEKVAFRENALGRLLARLAPTAMVFSPAPLPDEVITALVEEDRAYARDAGRVIVDEAQRGDLIVLGRAGAIVLREHPEAFHVRLDGPHPARVARAMATANITRREAERRLAATDREREGYVEHFYKCDPRDARHYHLVLQATAYPIDDVVQIIKTAHDLWQTARAPHTPATPRQPAG